MLSNSQEVFLSAGASEVFVSSWGPCFSSYQLSLASPDLPWSPAPYSGVLAKFLHSSKTRQMTKVTEKSALKLYGLAEILHKQVPLWWASINVNILRKRCFVYGLYVHSTSSGYSTSTRCSWHETTTQLFFLSSPGLWHRLGVFWA